MATIPSEAKTAENVPEIDDQRAEIVPPSVPEIDKAFYANVKDIYRNQVFATGIRCDGRKIDEIRPISVQADAVPAVHGSALFERGHTQVLCTVALDSLDAHQMRYRFDQSNEDNQMGEHRSNSAFTLSYLFPQYANNVIDVSGVAVGLFVDEQRGSHVLLADLLGFEDFVGDIDLKVAGTHRGVTAIQLDCKLNQGITHEILADALNLAHSCNVKIMKLMSDELPKSRDDFRPWGPVLQSFVVPQYKRSQFIGRGGVNLKALQADFNVTLYQSDEKPDTWHLHAPNKESLQFAMAKIEETLQKAEHREIELEFGATYKVRIVEMRENGVLVTLGSVPNDVTTHQRGDLFIPLSQLDTRRVAHPSALGLNVGDEIYVRYFGRDPTSGRHRLSRKMLLATRGRTIDTVRRTQKSVQSPWITKK